MIIFLSKNKIKKAFEEWDRQYREDPHAFQDICEHLLKNTPASYGELCASYFEKLLTEV